MDSILLSVVVPTRNRGEYARPAIRGMLASLPASAELVVEDNSDIASLGDWIASELKDERVAYRHTPGSRSMSENYEAGVERARGRFVAVVGDDDCVLRELGRAAQWADRNRVDAVTPTTPAHYVWIDLAIPRAGAVKAGELQLRPFSGRLTFADPATELARVLMSAAQEFYGLPKVYYGLVRRKCLEAVKQRTGRYFPGVSPDMAAAVALALSVRRVCCIDYPLFLPGSSLKSNAGLSGLRQHVGWLRDQRHLPSDVEAAWSRIVPAFFSVETIWAESAISALCAMGRVDLVRRFNVAKLYTLCFTWHPEFARVTLATFPGALRAAGSSWWAGWARLLAELAGLWRQRATFLIARLGSHPSPPAALSWGGLINVEAAANALEQHLAESAPSPFAADE